MHLDVKSPLSFYRFCSFRLDDLGEISRFEPLSILELHLPAGEGWLIKIDALFLTIRKPKEIAT